MYDLNLLKRDYGVIRKYEQPKDHFQGSILNLSNTGGCHTVYYFCLSDLLLLRYFCIIDTIELVNCALHASIMSTSLGYGSSEDVISAK